MYKFSFNLEVAKMALGHISPANYPGPNIYMDLQVHDKGPRALHSGWSSQPLHKSQKEECIVAHSSIVTYQGFVVTVKLSWCNIKGRVKWSPIVTPEVNIYSLIKNIRARKIIFCRTFQWNPFWDKMCALGAQCKDRISSKQSGCCKLIYTNFHLGGQK